MLENGFHKNELKGIPNAFKRQKKIITHTFAGSALNF
jgi:hypothetical protein